MSAILKSRCIRATQPQADLADQHGRINRSPRAPTGAARIALGVLILSVHTALPASPEQLDFFEQCIRHEVPDSKMPKDRPQIPDAVIADFVTWVNQGAVDPHDQPPTGSEVALADGVGCAATLKTRRDRWSFQPVRKPAVPQVKNVAWSEHPVDRFLLAKMEARGLQPSPAASRESLLRRVATRSHPTTPPETIQ